MLNWRDLIFSRGFLYFIISIIAPFIACLYLLQAIDNFEYAEAKSLDEKSVESIQNSLSLVFFGDAMFDRNVRKLMDREGFDYPFTSITPFIKEHDISIVNLEGVYTDNASVSVYNHEILRYTYDPMGTSNFHNAGFDFASQANNHSNDFGREGAQASRWYLESNGINSIGDFFNESDAVLFEQKGEKVALIGFNEFSNNNLKSAEEKIALAKTGGYFVIVFAHFGVEYERFPSDNQRQHARRWIDAGADLVIGAHPHVIEPVEEYKGKLIFYSLGNFVFDQYFSREVQTGLAISVILDQKIASYKITPIEITQSKPAVLQGTKAWNVLSEFASDSEVSKDIKEKINKGELIKMPR